MRQPQRKGDADSSAGLVRRRLAELSLSKTDLARMVGVSPDYIFRILNGRVPFPKVRETLEALAEALGLAPEAFAEYRLLLQAVPPSTALVWSRMKALGLDREGLFQALGGRLSRPYFNSILRGDQPFPSNRAFINLFALALELEPEAFPEFQVRPQERRGQRLSPGEVEAKALALCFQAALIHGGYGEGPGPELKILAPLAQGLLPAQAQCPALPGAVLARCAAMALSFEELALVAGCSSEALLDLVRALQAPWSPASEEAWRQLALALRVPIPTPA